MSHTVFKDPLLEKTFQEKGYVTVPFLSAEEIEELKQLFFDTIAQSGGPRTSDSTDFDSKAEISYDFTFIDKNVEYKKKVYDLITQRFQSKANYYLNGYTPIIANYIRKKEGGGEVPMHQNWAFVDEETYTSVSIWVPLVDSNEENGTLQMVAGSHKRFGRLRGPMIPWELRHIKEQIVSKHLTPMNVTAGEGVILDDSIVHYSNINTTPGLRLAIQLIMIPEQTHAIHYHFDREKNPELVQELETDVDFYMGFHPWLKPVGKKELRTFPYAEKAFSYADFLQALKGERFDVARETPESPMQPLFLDAETQKQFDRDGYVKIPLLNAEQVTHLKSYYDRIKGPDAGTGFHISLEHKSEAYIDGVYTTLYGTLVPELDKVVTNYKAFTASYVVKEPGLKSVVPPHQDWSFVDESQFCSATVWIPLMNVTKHNGALGVIKGSHRLFAAPRSSPSPQAKSVLSDHMFNLFPYVEVIEMKAGEALIFNNKTIHASPPNLSEQARIGVGIGITQKAASLRHYYTLPGVPHDLEVYEVDDSFFKTYTNAKLGKLYDAGSRPAELKVIGRVKNTKQNFTQEAITQLVSSTPGVKIQTELMQEMAALYNYNTSSINSQHMSTPGEHPHNSNTPGQQQPAATTQPQAWVDNRTFFQKYTPKNIIAEIKYRLTKK